MQAIKQENYEFYLGTNVNKYIGEWVAIVDKKIVAHGKNVKEVMKEARLEFPKKRVLLVRVPDKETMIF